MRSFITAAALLASAATSVNAITLNINNWSNKDNVMWVDGSQKVVLKAHSVTPHALASGPDHVLKIAVSEAGNPMYTNNIMQFEWSLDSMFSWDLSDINGNPFGAGNVKVTPTGAGVNSAQWPMCKQLKCPAGSVCQGAYQKSDPLTVRDKTRPCPTNTGTMWLDLWEPTNNFNTRDLHFSA